MASVKMSFNDETVITHNERKVDLKLYATAWWYYSKATRSDPAYDETEIDEIEISEAHYQDTNEPVSSDEILDDVRKDLENNFDFYFSHDEPDEDYSGMDCVDRWNAAHGIAV